MCWRRETREKIAAMHTTRQQQTTNPEQTIRNIVRLPRLAECCNPTRCSNCLSDTFSGPGGGVCSPPPFAASGGDIGGMNGGGMMNGGTDGGTNNSGMMNGGCMEDGMYGGGTMSGV